MTRQGEVWLIDRGVVLISGHQSHRSSCEGFCVRVSVCAGDGVDRSQSQFVDASEGAFSAAASSTYSDSSSPRPQSLLCQSLLCVSVAASAPSFRTMTRLSVVDQNKLGKLDAGTEDSNGNKKRGSVNKDLPLNPDEIAGLSAQKRNYTKELETASKKKKKPEIDPNHPYPDFEHSTTLILSLSPLTPTLIFSAHESSS